MKTTYTDLHLQPKTKILEQTRELIKKSVELGYGQLGIAFPTNIRQEEISALQELCKHIGADLVTRIDLAPYSARELLTNLRTLRNRFEVIAVQCYSKEIARQAAKDHRVDMLSFPLTGVRKRFFDPAEAELASKAAASLEIDSVPLLYSNAIQRVHLISLLRKEAALAKKFDIPIVLSSGASDTYQLRSPMDYASLCYLFDLDVHSAKHAVCENPQSLVERNRRKMSRGYVAPGVHIVRRGKDCDSA